LEIPRIVRGEADSLDGNQQVLAESETDRLENSSASFFVCWEIAYDDVFGDRIASHFGISRMFPDGNSEWQDSQFPNT
jgi:hypothetical protein